jgi:hypothetical protein
MKTSRLNQPRPIGRVATPERRGNRPSTGKKIGAAVAATLVLVGGAKAIDAVNQIGQDAVYQPERAMVGEWLKKGSVEVSPVVVTVSSKATTRETPAIRNSQTDADLDNRADLLTEENTTLVIKYPFSKTDERGDVFVGFENPKNPIDHKEVASLTSREDREKAIADHLTWVSANAKGDNGEPLVKFYDMPAVESHNPILANIASDGRITVGSEIAPAGQAMIMPARDAAFMVAQTLRPATS